MQTVSDQFIALAKGPIRPISWRVLMSFDKQFDENIDFFTIETSVIGGGDFIKPDESDVVQEWDKYIYTDYSDRVLSLEWRQEIELYSSVTMQLADVVLDNYDDLFTPNGGSTLQNYILPYRPIRIYSGFEENELIPQFVGLTLGMPKIDEKNKRVIFTCIDFFFSILNRPLTQSVMYVNYRVDQILQGLFEVAGLTSSQVVLDESSTILNFADFRKDSKLLDGVKELIEADMGRIYMDEYGVIRYKTRQNFSTDVVYEFNCYRDALIYDSKTSDDRNIVNVVELKGNAQEEQPKQLYYSLKVAQLVPANSSKVVWVEFQDPVTSVDQPVYYEEATTSSFRVNTLQNGTGDNNPTAVTLTDFDLFATSYKMTFTNSSSNSLWITSIDLFATPVIAVQPLYIREEDDTSVSQYDERVLSISNRFFQNASDMQSFALVALADLSEFGSILDLDVRGSPHLQVNDLVRVNLFDRIDDYVIMKITNKITYPMKYTQLLQVKKFTRRNYFTIAVSLIGGTDEIRP